MEVRPIKTPDEIDGSPIWGLLQHFFRENRHLEIDLKGDVGIVFFTLHEKVKAELVSLVDNFTFQR